VRKLVLFLLLLAPLPSLAFAPAPFPKPERGLVDVDDVKKIQGTWVRVLHNGQPTSGVIVVKDNVWRANIPSDSWYVKLDATKRPKQIDLVSVNNKDSHFRGVYKLEGDTFTYSVRYRAKEAERALDFEVGKPNASVSVHKRKGP